MAGGSRKRAYGEGVENLDRSSHDHSGQSSLETKSKQPYSSLYLEKPNIDADEINGEGGERVAGFFL